MTYFHRTLLFAVPLIVTLLAVPCAWADEPEEMPALPGRDAPSRFGLGLVAGNRQRPYKGLDQDTRVLPMLTYEKRWVRVQGLGAAFKLGGTDNVSFGLKVDYSLKGYRASDAPILEGMEDRKGSFWVGPNVRWRTDIANLSAELSGDVSGHSKGMQARLSADRTFRWGAFGLTPRASLLWMDRKYVDYYFGVRGEEARPDRPSYDGESTLNAELGLRAGYLLAPNQSVFLDLSVTKLGRGIKDSPLVDKSAQGGFRVGYLYRF